MYKFIYLVPTYIYGMGMSEFEDKNTLIILMHKNVQTYNTIFKRYRFYTNLKCCNKKQNKTKNMNMASFG